MKITTRQLPGSLLLLTLFTACSRPVAYVQPSIDEHIVAASPQSTSLIAEPSSVTQDSNFTSEFPQLPARANSSLDKVDAIVSNTNKLATERTNQRYLRKMRLLLAATSGKTSAGTTQVVSPGKMTFVERLMVKKLNTRIKRQLAPTNPEKTWASKSILVIGAVLLLGGILLLAFTSGGGFALGAIALAAGLVLLLVELL